MRFATLRHSLQRVLGAAVLVSLLCAAAGESSKRRTALILARVLSYERTLDARVGDSIGVAVVCKTGDPISEANADDWLTALNELSTVKIKDKPFFAIKVPYGPTELASAIDKNGIDVVLVCDGLTDAELASIGQLARSRRILTAGNTVAMVEKSLTLCVLEEGEKPRIFINLNTAELEGIQFSSSLLKLARLVH